MDGVRPLLGKVGRPLIQQPKGAERSRLSACPVACLPIHSLLAPPGRGGGGGRLEELPPSDTPPGEQVTHPVVFAL